MSGVNNSFEQITKLETGNEISSSFGDTVKVELPHGVYTNEIQLYVELGTLNSGSYDADAEYDLFDRVKLVLNGEEEYDITGFMAHFLQSYEKGVTVNTPLRIPVAHALKSSGVPVGGIPRSKLTNAELKLELDDIGDISGGSSQSGAYVKVAARQSNKGNFSSLQSFNYYTKNFSGTGEKTIDLKESGQMTGFVFNQDTATVDNIKVVTRDSNGETTHTNVSFEEIRRKNAIEAGNDSLPTGWIVVPLSDRISFADNDLVRVELDVTGTGSVEFYPRTLKSVS